MENSKATGNKYTVSQDNGLQFVPMDYMSAPGSDHNNKSGI